MFQLVYASAAAWPMGPNDLNTIVDTSRERNRRSGITGILLYIDQGFLQILEGPRDAVLEAFGRIQKDLRHIGLRVLVQQEVEARVFDDWSMGFDRLDPQAPRSADVFEITQEAIQQKLPPDKAAMLALFLRNFYRINAGQSVA